MSDTKTRFSDRPIDEQWAKIRRMIADGNEGSYPRDWFEALHEPGARFEIDGVECVVVPVEPTPAMGEAAGRALTAPRMQVGSRRHQSVNDGYVAWRAMIAAVSD